MTDTTTESSIRDTLSATMEVLEDESTSVEHTESTPEQSYAPTDDNVSTEGENAATEPEKASREYNRDEAGKFAKAEAEKAAKAAKEAAQPRQEMTPGPKSGPKEQRDPTERAPQAWRPAAREHWAQIPKEAREEIIRHEQQVKHTLQETAEIRRYADAINKTLEPYRHFIKAEGANDFQAIDNMMAAAAKLRTGTSNDIAQFVSQVITQYGVGRFGPQFIQTLDATLSGYAPQQVDPQVAAMQQRFEQELAPLRQMQQQMQWQQQQQEQQLNAMANDEVSQFLSTVDFGYDVRNEMADIIDMGAARGVNYTLQQAYDIACRAHPEISRVMQQREQAKIAQSMNQNAQRARSAAVSVGGSPAMGAPETPPGSIRDAIQFALNQNSR